MNEEAHWNAIGSNYNNEIFDVFKSDKYQRLSYYFEKYANRQHHAIDFGCGNGKSFEYLCPRFKKLTAIDISEELLSEAKKRPVSNVDFKRMDLTKKGLTLSPVDFLFCCNVAMLPEIQKTWQMIENARKALKKGGHAIFVLPSIDSVFFASWQLIEMYKKEGIDPDDIPGHEFNYFKGSKRDIIQGIIHIDGVPTKHFGRTELDVVFQNTGFRILTVDKVEYDWTTEFTSPPKWLGEPFPWDWLVECVNE